MTFAVASDHAGYPLKQTVVEDLKGLGHQVIDLGPPHPDPNDDYPDFAALVCEAIRDGKGDRGILLCGSGVGVSVAANKFPGIRAAICHDHYSAHQGVEHDDMNVLCIGTRIVGPEVARELATAFAQAAFTHEDRHARRLAKVKAIEKRFLRG